MQKSLTSEELRTAANQAITLALAAGDETRESLLRLAAQLLLEADTLDEKMGR